MTNSDTYLVKLNCANQKQAPHSQKGFVLFLALVSLVVMSLAAVALIRSVDTNSLITGNLAYRQNATLSSAYGLEAVAQTIGPQLKGYEEVNDAGDGYYATCLTFDAAATNPCGGERLTQDAQWVPDTTSQLADGLPGLTNGVDPFGNTVQYIVERMCNQAGATQLDRCMTTTSAKDPAGCGDCGGKMDDILTDYPLYRITVRIAGPKNTISYVQGFLS
jgi:type IV pilus assembly protein PilX